MPHMVMDHANDPRTEILENLGDISDFELLHNNVLVAVYIRPTKTKSGIFLTDKTLDEDRWQSKCGLVVATGPDAFKDETGQWNWGVINNHDWVVFRPSDGWNCTLKGNNGKEAVLCRVIQDTSIKAVVTQPDMVW